MQTKRLTQQAIERRKDILETAIKYTLARKRNYNTPSKDKYAKVIEVISKMYEDQWTVVQLMLQYQKHYGDMLAIRDMQNILFDIQRGGGIIQVTLRHVVGGEVMYAICDNNINIQCTNIYTQRYLTSIPINEKLNQCVREILKEYKLEMITANLTIFVKK